MTAPPSSPNAWRNRAIYLSYRAAAAAAGAVPEAVGAGVARGLAGVAVPLLGHRRRMVAQHARRVSGRPLSQAEERRAVRAAFGSYSRYWMESLRLPAMSPEEVDDGFSIDGLEHIRTGLDAGRGVVLALPHVGGWEVGGSWLVRQGIPLTVVVESLQPPELFEWFVGLRESFGLTVIPLGKGAGTQVLRTLRGNGVVALLSDRDIGGRGVEVEFFGERTTLPGGPATLALRAGAPVLPTAVYFAGSGHHAVVQGPVTVPRTGRLRDDVAVLTQAIACQLEELIRAAPDQWHLFQPNWPSDRL
ncbi:MAG: phosphatidylinositol mannoside acyltransferase [Acidimicrobiales bacterium]